MTNEQILYIKGIEAEIADLQKENVFDEEIVTKIITDVKNATEEGFKFPNSDLKGNFKDNQNIAV